MTKTTVMCRTYIADGKTISSTECFGTPEEAKARAKAWSDFGHKAEAVAFVVDLATGEVGYRPL